MCAQHTDPNEAVQILEDLEAARAVGIHWGVFRLTDEHRDEPPELLLKALARRGIAENLFPAGVARAELLIRYDRVIMSGRGFESLPFHQIFQAVASTSRSHEREWARSRVTAPRTVSLITKEEG